MNIGYYLIKIEQEKEGIKLRHPIDNIIRQRSSIHMRISSIRLKLNNSFTGLIERICILAKFCTRVMDVIRIGIGQQSMILWKWK